MKKIPDESIHAVITDPPYGIEFMSLKWDTEFDTAQGERLFQATGSVGDKGFGTLPAFRGMSDDDLKNYYEFTVAWSSEVLRILKPGGYLLSFGGIKTHDILMMGFRQSGFEIRDMLIWAFASGFPKGQDISKEFDRVAGVERPVIRKSPNVRPAKVAGAAGFERLLTENLPEKYDKNKHEDFYITAPVTEDAKKWNGWRTNLKPAYEPIVMAQKPRIGSFIENVKEHEVGALNIDAIRIQFNDDRPDSVKADTYWYRMYSEKTTRPNGLGGLEPTPTKKGAGDFKSPHPGDHKESWETKKPRHDYFANPLGRYPTNVIRITPFNDGYDPLFLISKPSMKEKGVYNIHPTCKPLRLMEHLIKLVTREDQIILDPFVGSGTTCIAAYLLNRKWIGIDKEEEYLKIALQRMKDVKKQYNISKLIKRKK
jgi:site-specific DNA-methyltransferase (adenine-specific)